MKSESAIQIMLLSILLAKQSTSELTMMFASAMAMIWLLVAIKRALKNE